MKEHLTFLNETKPRYKRWLENKFEMQDNFFGCMRGFSDEYFKPTEADL